MPAQPDIARKVHALHEQAGELAAQSGHETHAPAAAPAVTLDDVAHAYPTWQCWPTVGGCMARAALVPAWAVHAATAAGLLAAIEASIQQRREGGAPTAAHAGRGGVT